MINSTPLGNVTTAQRLGYHRNEAGYRIGDGKKVDMIRYLAWLVIRRHSERREGTADSYERTKEAARKHSIEQSASGRDIAPLPPVQNPERKEACRLDFRKFCETYYPRTFYLGWSDDHLMVVSQVQTSVLEGGLYATAMPRGSGKTSLCECACVWAILYGHRYFVPLISSDESNAVAMLESIKTELENNELLQEDFPEAVYPIKCLGGISLRCKGQLHEGKRTLIEWTNDQIVMPTIPGSKASGSIIYVAGITGQIRGKNFKRATGETIRPDLILVDDPQTDQSARSPSQCDTRERILKGAILGLAGPGKKVSGLMPCTVIADGDMADRFLDRDKHPEWNGTRTEMLYSFPVNMKLWEEYARIRGDSMRKGHGGREATEFYRQHRADMDAGARVAWEARHDPDELSAIQNAMNLFYDRGEDAFWAEFQNRPRKPDVARGDDLTPDKVMARVNRYARARVPISCNHITAMIDISATILWYVVAAWNDDFTGFVIDYGAFPDQKTPYFTLRNARVRIADRVQARTLEGQIEESCKWLIATLCKHEWHRDDGAGMRIERGLIDANYGPTTDTVYKACTESEFSSIFTPSHGIYIGAKSKPMSQYDNRPGDRTGLNWRMPNVQGKRAVRYVNFDTNFWKGFIHNRLNMPTADRGSLTIFGENPEQHAMFADQICAEYRVRTSGRERELDEFLLRPGGPDNHFLDCLAGCAVGASMQGVVIPSTRDTNKQEKKVSFAEMARRKREQRRNPQPTA